MANVPMHSRAVAATMLLLFSNAAAYAVENNKASSLIAVEQALSNYEQAWAASNISLEKALFVKRPANAYGNYEVVDTAKFAQGQPLHVYLEPVAYKFKKQADWYSFDLTVDFAIRNQSGQILAEKQGFAHLNSRSKNKIKEYQSSLTFAFQGLPEGKYNLLITVHDDNADQNATVDLPFEMLP
ncbi:hypothetical protein [Polycladidibacter stylochi]|uniref:hypothetical protein n=1 Tax=Polycladidibacter stylochi TaxID=1807766 RepID=UPI000832B0D2|nr:hypothetical protein [Pseudovibrio stylochi]